MSSCENPRNYLQEVSDIINEIECRVPEPEICNIRCPPLGCPRGPCPGVCAYDGVPDACCMSKMPCCAPPPPLLCRAPPACLLKAYAKAVGYPPESCFSPPKARLRLLLGFPARRNLQIDCSPQSPCYFSPPNCTSCCPASTFSCF
ncbi:sperm mitochondrial-associated cysteine-rich protein-like [Osmia bicornis bicornis]|uniref:sperm mitochondrial-associated cysteine-rich protein-like n=1 Tax=Osmia bicornis bicornis TaxID=1437191 RepID=UPI001EAEE2AD|nr:sperm mitochondrial-associated cysteine-rich protein-like [Osmia bicornis bicornis]